MLPSRVFAQIFPEFLCKTVQSRKPDYIEWGLGGGRSFALRKRRWYFFYLNKVNGVSRIKDLKDGYASWHLFTSVWCFLPSEM